MATEPTIMKLKLSAIHKIVSKIDRDPSLSGLSELLQGKRIGESELATTIRTILSNAPKGYTKAEPSLKNRAKERFVQWREMQAKGEWKKLSEDEKARWISYVEEGADLGTIRQRELGLEEDLNVGDSIVIQQTFSNLGRQYSAGETGVIRGKHWDEVVDRVAYRIELDRPGAFQINTYRHEIRKVKP